MRVRRAIEPWVQDQAPVDSVRRVLDRLFLTQQLGGELLSLSLAQAGVGGVKDALVAQAVLPRCGIAFRSMKGGGEGIEHHAIGIVI